jgi:hypothetical protein
MDELTNQAFDTIKTRVRDETQPYVVGIVSFHAILIICLIYIIIKLRKLENNFMS